MTTHAGLRSDSRIARAKIVQVSRSTPLPITGRVIDPPPVQERNGTAAQSGASSQGSFGFGSGGRRGCALLAQRPPGQLQEHVVQAGPTALDAGDLDPGGVE